MPASPCYGILGTGQPTAKDTMSTPLNELEARVLGLGAADRAWVSEALRHEAQVKAGSARMAPGDEALQRARARVTSARPYVKPGAHQ